MDTSVKGNHCNKSERLHETLTPNDGHKAGKGWTASKVEPVGGADAMDQARLSVEQQASLTARNAVPQAKHEPPAKQMLALSDLFVLDAMPERLKIAQQVVAFYDNPTAFDGATGVDMSLSMRTIAWLAGRTVGQGGIPDRVPGSECYPFVSTLRTDEETGTTAWLREIEVDGVRQPLFEAGFVSEGKTGHVVETFDLFFFRQPLYFNVMPNGRGGITLTLTVGKHPWLARVVDIVYDSVPIEGGGLRVRGEIRARGVARWLGISGTFYADLWPKQEPPHGNPGPSERDGTATAK